MNQLIVGIMFNYYCPKCLITDICRNIIFDVLIMVEFICKDKLSFVLVGAINVTATKLSKYIDYNRKEVVLNHEDHYHKSKSNDLFQLRHNG